MRPSADDPNKTKFTWLLSLDLKVSQLSSQLKGEVKYAISGMLNSLFLLFQINMYKQAITRLIPLKS